MFAPKQQYGVVIRSITYVLTSYFVRIMHMDSIGWVAIKEYGNRISNGLMFLIPKKTRSIVGINTTRKTRRIRIKKKDNCLKALSNTEDLLFAPGM